MSFPGYGRGQVGVLHDAVRTCLVIRYRQWVWRAGDPVRVRKDSVFLLGLFLARFCFNQRELNGLRLRGGHEPARQAYPALFGCNEKQAVKKQGDEDGMG